MRPNLFKLYVIGAGGAFDTQHTNSSFLLEYELVRNHKKYALFDCGYNVFPKLVNNPQYKTMIKDIDNVFITHFDDDHVGSLKSFLYYRYFIEGKPTKVHVPYMCKNYAEKFFESLNSQYSGSMFEHANQIEEEYLSSYDPTPTKLAGNIVVTPIQVGLHHVPVSGFKIEYIKQRQHEYNRISRLIITGDTKAHGRIEQQALEKSYEQLEDVIILHDYSFWDAPSKQVHACKSDMKIEYSEDFLKHTIIYHNVKAAEVLEDKVIVLRNDMKFYIEEDLATNFAKRRGILASDIVLHS